MIISDADTIQTVATAVQSISELLNYQSIGTIVKIMDYKGGLNIEQITFILVNYLYMSKPEMYNIYPNNKEPINYFINRAIECSILPKKGKNYRPNIKCRTREINDFIFLNYKTMSLREMGKALNVSKSLVKSRLDKIKKTNFVI